MKSQSALVKSRNSTIKVLLGLMGTGLIAITIFLFEYSPEIFQGEGMLMMIPLYFGVILVTLMLIGVYASSSNTNQRGVKREKKSDPLITSLVFAAVVTIIFMTLLMVMLFYLPRVLGINSYSQMQPILFSVFVISFLLSRVVYTIKEELSKKK